jgi:hypothetical protein
MTAISDVAHDDTELVQRHIQGTGLPEEPLEILVIPSLAKHQAAARIHQAS